MELVTISKELQLATHMSAPEIRQELALHLYAHGKLSAGKARELAGLSAEAFQCLLGARGMLVNYGVEEFHEDLETIHQLQLDQ